MGIGTGLAFMALGAILAFATHFSTSGIDVRMIGWILMLLGAAMLIITFAYTRPRRRRQVTEIVDLDRPPVEREEPVEFRQVESRRIHTGERRHDSPGE